MAVDAVSLEVVEGQTLVMLGSSGSGKTTTLKMINRLIEPSAGTIEVDGCDVRGQDLYELRRSIGYAFQGIGLFPHMTVRQNVSIVPRLLGWPRARRRERAEELLEIVGLGAGTFAERYPRELSGGQQQRVGVARALAADPKYLLMDEPFGALDAVTRQGLQDELLAIKKRLGKTVVFVTHDIFEAMKLADRLAVLHEGRVEQVGEPGELMRNPATAFVAELLSKPAEQLSALEKSGNGG
ncbi:MAG: ATP-binding cassette domain-containing protein [Phycisphaeraceae bacterium]|nr:ATP-binding cassette domain-containing protein [Phycisphaeraceae bacterium]